MSVQPNATRLRELRSYGQVPVLSKEFISKLGHTAYCVLSSLWSFRNDDGFTHVTIDRLSRPGGHHRPVSQANIRRRALPRLKAAGLVQDVGWRKLPVPLTGRDGTVTTVIREVFVRRVLGAPAHVGRARQFVVPGGTWWWLQHVAVPHGGARKGAGRRRTLESADRAPGAIKCPPPPGQSSVLPDLDQDPLPGSSSATSASSFPSETKEPSCTQLGFSFSDDGSGNLPPYPDTHMVGTAFYPAPPKLPADLPDKKLVKILADTYTGAVRSCFRSTKCRVTSVPTLSNKAYANLVEVGRLLEAQDISPGQWAMWSIDVWREHTKRKTPPTLAWIFSAERVKTRAGWFGREKAGYGGGRIALGDSERALAHRWNSMMAAIVRGTMGRAEAVHHYFPDNTFARMLVEAQAEAKDLKNRLKAQVERGIWIW